MPMKGDMVFEAYEADLIDRQVSAGYLKRYREVTRSFAAFCDPDTATRDDVQAWLRSHQWGGGTQRTNYAQVRAAYTYREKLYRVPSPCFLPRFSTYHPPPPSIVPDTRRRAMEAACATWDDTLLLRMFTYTGMRTCEVSRCTWNDIDGEVMFIHGKGGKPREIPVHPKLREALNQVEMRSAWVVWNTRTRGRLAEPGVAYRLRRLGPVRPHDLRSTFARALRVSGAGHTVIQWMLGHNPRDVTDRHYDWVSPEEMRAALLRLYT